MSLFVIFCLPFTNRLLSIVISIECWMFIVFRAKYMLLHTVRNSKTFSNSSNHVITSFEISSTYSYATLLSRIVSHNPSLPWHLLRIVWALSCAVTREALWFHISGNFLSCGSCDCEQHWLERFAQTTQVFVSFIASLFIGNFYQRLIENFNAIILCLHYAI